MRWSNDEDQSISFDQILSSKQSAHELLGNNNIVEDIKGRSSKFTQKQQIIQEKYRHILYELIDIALIPQIYMQAKQITIDKTATHNAIQILSNLSEEFIQEIFDKSPEEQDSVIQTEKEYPILNHLFKILSYESALETPLAYFNKIITPFIYQRSEDMIKIVNTQFLNSILNHFWNPSVSDIIVKIIEAETEKDFFEKQKIALIKNVCKQFEVETNQAKLQRNIKNLGYFIQSLVEKHEDKYDKSKYAKLIKILLEENACFNFLFKHIETYHTNHHIKIQVLHCIQNYLRIHLKTSNQNSRIEDSTQNINDSIKLNKQFEQNLKQYLLKHKIQQFISDSRIQLFNYYRLIKTSLIIQPNLVGDILTQEFISNTISLMKKDINNNILHNFQRDILIRGIKQSEKVCEILQNDKEIGVQSLLSSKLSDKNSRNCYENQIFLIFQAVKQRSQQGSQLLSEGWSNLNSLIDNKRKFYSVLIGGNPRGDDDEKWENMDNQNQMIFKSMNNNKETEPSKQTIEQNSQKNPGERKIMINVASSGLEDLGGTEVLSEQEDETFNTASLSNSKNKHFFDFELPLDSDKEENQLGDFPQTIRMDSNQNISLRNSQKSLTKSDEGIKVSNEVKQEENALLPTVIQDPVEHTTHITIEESFKEEQSLAQIPPKTSQLIPTKPFQVCRQQIECCLYSKYSLHLKQQVPHRQQIEQLLLCKYNLSIK